MPLSIEIPPIPSQTQLQRPTTSSASRAASPPPIPSQTQLQRPTTSSAPRAASPLPIPPQMQLQRLSVRPTIPIDLKTEAVARCFHAELQKFEPAATLEFLFARERGRWDGEETGWRIHLPDCPITAVDLKLGYGEPEGVPYYSNQSTFRTHDERLAGIQQQFRIRSVRRKSIPVIGPALEVSWRGSPSSAVAALSSNSKLKRTVRIVGDIKIRNDPQESSWIISGMQGFGLYSYWPAYKVVGRILLESPLDP